MTQRLVNMDCIYCGEEQWLYVPVDTPEMDDYSDFLEPVPAVNDHAMWRELAADHLADCEWVITRAHRR